MAPYWKNFLWVTFMIQNINSTHFNFLCSGWCINFLSPTSRELWAWRSHPGRGAEAWPHRHSASPALILSMACTAQGSFWPGKHLFMKFSLKCLWIFKRKLLQRKNMQEVFITQNLWENGKVLHTHLHLSIRVMLLIQFGTGLYFFKVLFKWVATKNYSVCKIIKISAFSLP